MGVNVMLYIITVKLKKSHSDELREQLINFGFEPFKVDALTHTFEPLQKNATDEPDIPADQDYFFYEYIYNSSKRPQNLIDIIEKLEGDPSMIYYSLQKSVLPYSKVY